MTTQQPAADAFISLSDLEDTSTTVAPSIPQILLLLLFALTFVHFLVAGSRTFATSLGDDLGAVVAKFSFLITGITMVSILGLRHPIRLYNGIGAALLLLCSLVLYEWARHIIWGRRFHIAWSGRTPELICDNGPYEYVRHPIYVSYMLSFLAVLVALPGPLTLATFLINVTLFTHAAFSDERSLSDSPLANAYTQYRKDTGMLFPRLFRRRRFKSQ